MLYEAYERGQIDMLTKCLAVVESMRQAQNSTWTHGEYLSRRSVIAALRELLP